MKSNNIILLYIFIIIFSGGCNNDDLPRANAILNPPSYLEFVVGHEQVLVSWVAPQNDNLKEFEVSWSPDGEVITLGLVETNLLVKELKNDQQYNFIVKSIYVDDGKNHVNGNVTPVDELNFKAFAGSELVLLQWDQPNRTDIVGYELSIDSGSEIIQLGLDTQNYIVNDLENGREYVFTLTPKYEDGSIGDPVEQIAIPGFIEMIFATETLVNLDDGDDENDSIDFSYNPVFLLNQEIAAFNWDFSDGTFADTETVSHTFNAPGKYEVSLEITDTNGATFSSTKAIDVLGINWEFAASDHIKGVTALRGNDGTLYIGDSAGTFYAINPDGTEKMESFSHYGVRKPRNLRRKPFFGTRWYDLRYEPKRKSLCYITNRFY